MSSGEKFKRWETVGLLAFLPLKGKRTSFDLKATEFYSTERIGNVALRDG